MVQSGHGHTGGPLTLSFSLTVLDKAERLADRGSVLRNAATADAYKVVGDHGRYNVYLTVQDGAVVHGVCTCPHGGPGCSHVAAVLLARRRGLAVPTVLPEGQPADPFADLTA